MPHATGGWAPRSPAPVWVTREPCTPVGQRGCARGAGKETPCPSPSQALDRAPFLPSQVTESEHKSEPVSGGPHWEAACRSARLG